MRDFDVSCNIYVQKYRLMRFNALNKHHKVPFSYSYLIEFCVFLLVTI